MVWSRTWSNALMGARKMIAVAVTGQMKAFA